MIFNNLPKNLSPVAYRIVAGLCILAAMWAWGYFSLLRSPRYQYGVEYLKRDSAVESKLGKIFSSRPEFFYFADSYGSGRWSTKFYVVLVGEKGKGEAFMHLENFGSTWTIKRCDLKTGEETVSIVTPTN